MSYLAYRAWGYHWCPLKKKINTTFLFYVFYYIIFYVAICTVNVYSIVFIIKTFLIQRAVGSSCGMVNLCAVIFSWQ